MWNEAKKVIRAVIDVTKYEMRRSRIGIALADMLADARPRYRYETRGRN